MNDILHIVGNRPQFIKLSPVSKELKKVGLQQVIIHTGQHYDKNMSDIFFEELEIPFPDANLNIGSGSHAEMTGQAMIALEKEILNYKPRMVIVYGDTNSTLAGALACKKLNYPLCHVEAGTRTFNRKNPEEINRIITDHISDILFCPDQISVNNLKGEGITENVFFSGDVMHDVFLEACNQESDRILKEIGLKKQQYFLMTWHRQENTDSKEALINIIKLIEKIDQTIVCPLHPRTRYVLEEKGLFHELEKMSQLICIDPVGYNEMIALNCNSRGVICDSGGLSKEAYYAGKKCLFTLELNVWPQLIKSGWMKQYTKDDKENQETIDWFLKDERPNEKNNFFGNGTAALQIAKILKDILSEKKE